MDTLEDSRSGASDRFEAFHEQSGIPSIQLNVVLAGVSGFKTDGPADDKRHGFRFGFSLPFRNVSSILPWRQRPSPLLLSLKVKIVFFPPLDNQ